MANIETALGLVLRTYPLTETSLIVHWLTPALGRLATVAKGARNPKSAYRGKLDLFYLADFSFSRSRRSELHTLREVTLRDSHPVLRQDLVYLQQASYAAALVELATETETPLPEIFELLRGFLQQLGSAEPRSEMIFAFEIKLLRELGLEPDLSHAHLGAGDKAALNVLAQADWPVILSLRLSPAQFSILQKFLHNFLLFHLGRLPKGRDAALAQKPM
jgi:DNA repair protein RecO (recombination protein O)